jgi:hypothetical protein
MKKVIPIILISSLFTTLLSANNILDNSKITGKLRLNSFIYDYKTIDKDHDITGIGASIIVKTPLTNIFSTTLGLYTSQTPFNKMSADEVSIAKSGKDLFSRHDVYNGNGWGLNVIGQAYIETITNNTNIKLGRQLFNTVYTKENDTKMIPNSFDGISLVNKTFEDTLIKVGYFTAQKLKDHSKSHDVVAFTSWKTSDEGTDDTGANQSLTPDIVGLDNKLIVLTGSTNTLANHKIDLTIVNVPDVLTTSIFETKYYFYFKNNLKVIPAFRYINQQDNLHTSKDVANLKTNTTGYTNPTSLDSAAIMYKVDIVKDAWKLRFGYSKIDDKADLVAPWRGFPTGGYTRAMAQYNWYANTKTTMIRADYDFGKAGIANGYKAMIRYAKQDFDDNKNGKLSNGSDAVQADSDVIHIDIKKKISKDLSCKLRIGLVDMDVNSTSKTDNSYNEYRFEINYIF